MSKDYTSITTHNNGLPFPNTRAIDASGPTATDGTELVKEVIDDIWLEKQALLNFYNETPNGLDDEPGVDSARLPKSQPLALQYMNYGTPGKIVSLGWSTQPPLYGDPALISASLGFDLRILILNGQGILRNNYFMLDSLVYCGNINNATADSFYHANDAAGTIRSTSGAYLILPDYRGYAERGLDPSGTIDPEGAGRIVGSKQDDALQNLVGIFHIRRDSGGSPSIPYAENAFTLLTNGGSAITFNGSGTTRPVQRLQFDASNSPDARTDIETRTKNIAVRYGIYY
jgi:hypothetical protein